MLGLLCEGNERKPTVEMVFLWDSIKYSLSDVFYLLAVEKDTVERPKPDPNGTEESVRINEVWSLINPLRACAARVTLVVRRSSSSPGVRVSVTDDRSTYAWLQVVATRPYNTKHFH